jgi:RHS repeat-associated protein
VVKAEYTGINNSFKGYLLSGVSLNNPDLVTHAYFYDNYTFKNFSIFSGKDQYNYQTTTGFEDNRYGTDTDPVKSKGLLTGSIVGLMGISNSINTVYYYDAKGRMIQSTVYNHLKGYDTEYINYSFTGQPVWKQIVHNSPGKSGLPQIYRYQYDHANRLTKTYYQLDGNTERLLSELGYNSLGQVSQKKLYSGVGNTIAYTYNILNWVKTISSTGFQETLYYNDSPASTTWQYGGNIGDVEWRLHLNTNLYRYRYQYDGVNRLKKAQYMGDVLADNGFSEDLIQYDKNGALTADSYRGIAGITYNVLNLPERIQFMYGHNTQYVYDGDGVKRRMVFETSKNDLAVPLGTTNTQLTGSKLLSKLTTDYCGSVIYENGTVVRILNPEGYAAKNANNQYEYYYYLKDHLGNTRSVWKESNSEVVQETNYYAFGMPHTIVSAPRDGMGAEKQPYKFGGKEYDEMHGLNWYDFGARYYDGIIPRFMTMDPMAEKYYSISPYAYCLNNPLRYIDPTGMDTVWVHSDGTEIARIQAEGDEVMVVNDPLPEVEIVASAPPEPNEVADMAALAPLALTKVGDKRAGAIVATAILVTAADIWLQHQLTKPYPQYRTARPPSPTMESSKGGKQGKGERNYTSSPNGTNDPFKHMKPDPDNDKMVIYKDANGKTHKKQKPTGFDEYWNSKH